MLSCLELDMANTVPIDNQYLMKYQTVTDSVRLLFRDSHCGTVIGNIRVNAVYPKNHA